VDSATSRELSIKTESGRLRYSLLLFLARLCQVGESSLPQMIT